MGKFVRTAEAVILVVLCAFAVPAMADDWVASKLRGTVLQLVDGDWVKLKRGDVVPDERAIRTLRSGNVQFKRDAETIDLGPNTQVQIVDQSGKRYTTVKQYFGTVTVEAEVRNVQHFEVRTPHLAAVVKGTKFVVRSGKTGAAVKVTRGHVAVEDKDTHQSVTVSAGQSATALDGQSLKVAGKGDLPAVLDAVGKPVVEFAVGRGNSGKHKGAVNASVGGINLSVSVGGNGNGNSGNGSGNGGGSGNSGNGNGNSGNGSGNGGGSGNSGNSNGNGNSGNGNGNSGNGNGNGGPAASVIGLVGGLL